VVHSRLPCPSCSLLAGVASDLSGCSSRSCWASLLSVLLGACRFRIGQFLGGAGLRSKTSPSPVPLTYLWEKAGQAGCSRY
jgi:hypothetical protein